ncbi:MAG TPA: peptidoglycan bridge formation glycyltransferase FemA/FemB family protein [Candidatus Limnocylindrales bacterium]
MSLADSPHAGKDHARQIRVVDATDWTPSAWDDLTVRTPLGDAFQSHAWGELKSGLGWKPLRFVVEADGKQIAAVFIQERPLSRRLPGPLGGANIHYAPRGPILLEPSRTAAQAALHGLRLIARERHALTLTIDPTWVEGGDLAATLAGAGFRAARREVQVSRTAMIIPLQPTDETQHALLGDSTARNINKAKRAGVTTERVDLTDPAARGTALEEFFEMHAATGRREDFLVRDRDYALKQWRLLGESGVASLWFGVVDGRRRNGVLLLHCGRNLVSYAAGAPDDADLHKTRANHLLQWDILRWAAGAGFAGYDLGGVDTQTMPGLPQDESHPLWNLFQFKKSFGAVPELRIRDQEYAPNATLGTIWRTARRFR